MVADVGVVTADAFSCAYGIYWLAQLRPHAYGFPHQDAELYSSSSYSSCQDYLKMIAHNQYIRNIRSQSI